MKPAPTLPGSPLVRDEADNTIRVRVNAFRLRERDVAATAEPHSPDRRLQDAGGTPAIPALARLFAEFGKAMFHCRRGPPAWMHSMVVREIISAPAAIGRRSMNWNRYV